MLSIISRSPTDVQPVLDAIVESAAKVCGIDDVVLRLRETDTMVVRAHFGQIPIGQGRSEVTVDEPRYRWMREHGTLHIPDRREQNIIPPVGSVSEWRSWLGVPLRQQGELIGTLIARRMEVRPFTSPQIKMLETFADQAVIAIENVRLLKELKEPRPGASDGDGEVSASSPLADRYAAGARRYRRSAARVCAIDDVSLLRLREATPWCRAHFGPSPRSRRRI